MKKETENKTRAVSVFALLVVLMTSSAHGSERDSLAKVTEFIRMLWNIVSKLGKVYEVYPVLKVSLENQLV